MGTVFEELVRKFNEDNNEEAGEHWTPRDAVRLMANLVLLPVGDNIKSGTHLLYDCACGTGGMLTVAEETLTALAARHKQDVKCLLYGQEINPETYAVCKADMLLKGEGESANHIIGGAEWSTLAHDAFPAQEFHFMLSNPPYGKSWKKDLEAMGGKDGIYHGARQPFAASDLPSEPGRSPTAPAFSRHRTLHPPAPRRLTPPPHPAKLGAPPSPAPAAPQTAPLGPPAQSSDPATAAECSAPG